MVLNFIVVTFTYTDFHRFNFRIINKEYMPWYSSMKEIIHKEAEKVLITTYIDI